MIDALNTNGQALWMTLPPATRWRYHLSRIDSEVLGWVKVVLYLAHQGDSRALRAREQLFTKVKGHGYFPKDVITKRDARRATAPVLVEVFAGLNGRRFG